MPQQEDEEPGVCGGQNVCEDSQERRLTSIVAQEYSRDTETRCEAEADRRSKRESMVVQTPDPRRGAETSMYSFRCGRKAAAFQADLRVVPPIPSSSPHRRDVNVHRACCRCVSALCVLTHMKRKTRLRTTSHGRRQRGCYATDVEARGCGRTDGG